MGVENVQRFATRRREPGAGVYRTDHACETYPDRPDHGDGRLPLGPSRLPAKDLSEGHLELTAGLLEIAHDGGASVILEGPVKYTAESGTVGSLHYGKLTVLRGSDRA